MLQATVSFSSVRVQQASWCPVAFLIKNRYGVFTLFGLLQHLRNYSFFSSPARYFLTKAVSFFWKYLPANFSQHIKHTGKPASLAAKANEYCVLCWCWRHKSQNKNVNLNMLNHPGWSGHTSICIEERYYGQWVLLKTVIVS